MKKSKHNWIQGIIFIAVSTSNINLYSAQDHPTLIGMKAPSLQSFITGYYLMDSSKQMMTERRIRGPISGGFIHKTVRYPDMPLSSTLKHKAYSKLIQIGNRSIVEKDCSIGYNTTILENSHIHANVQIGNHVQIHQDVIIGKNTKIGNNVCIGVGAYIAPNTIIGDNSFIQNHAQLNFTEIPRPFPIKIGKHCSIGHDTALFNGVTVEDLTTIEKNCLILGPASSIGQRSYLEKNTSIERSTVGKDNRLRFESCLYQSTTENRVQIGYRAEIGPQITIGEGSDIPNHFVCKDNTRKTYIKAHILYSNAHLTENHISDIISVEFEDDLERSTILQGRIKKIQGNHEPLIQIITPEDVYQNAFEIEMHKQPCWNYEASLNSQCIGQHQNGHGECSICLNEFSEENSQFALHTCPHSFHKSCILPWFIENKTCPLCRSESYPNSQDHQNIIEDIKKALLNINENFLHDTDEVTTPTHATVNFHRHSENNDEPFFSTEVDLSEAQSNHNILLNAIQSFLESGLDPNQDYDHLEIMFR